MPGARSRIARVAALTRWAHEPDPQACGRRGQQGLRARFEREVDPDGSLPPAERAVRVDRLMRAHMISVRAKGVAKQALRAQERPGASEAVPESPATRAERGSARASAAGTAPPGARAPKRRTSRTVTP